MAKIYEIARDLKEAKELRDGGFGYEARKDAKKALADPGMDDFYRSKLKVFELEDEGIRG